MPIERVAVYYTTDGTEPSGERGTSANSLVVLAESGETVTDPRVQLPVRHWRAVVPGQPDETLVRYHVDGWSLREPELRFRPPTNFVLASLRRSERNDLHWTADRVDPVTMVPENGRIFAYNVDRWDVPDWWYDTVTYHIVVDRFNAASDEPPLHDPGDITGFFGGTLRGILEKLDYIQALGANCIWLSPVFESPTYHGYNPSDYYNVARHFGTNDTLHQLIKEAHQRGIRVMLDFVANHTSNEHPAFLDALSNPESPTAHWYTIGDWPPYGYRSYAMARDMPELVTEHPDVQRYLIDAALYWLGDLGADALRLDYVPGPSHIFWTMFQRAIKQHFPQAPTLGEITSPLPELVTYAGRIDAFMDFSLTKMLRRVFALREAPLTDLLRFLDERLPELPPKMGRATLLDNHDMNRFLWLAGSNTAQLKLAAVCHLTLEGSPIIYYGTEVGLSQSDDGFKENAYVRAAMLWGELQDLSLLEHYRQLVALRNSHSALRRGARLIVPVELVDTSSKSNSQVGAYLRWLDSEYLLVVLNNGEEPVRVRFSLTEQLALAGVKVDASPVLSNLLVPGQEVSLTNGLVELELPALGAAILGATQPIYH